MIPKPKISVEKLLKELKVLKDEIQYIKKKAEITPLIALYNHISGHNKEGNWIVCYIEISTKHDTLSFSRQSIMLINDSVLIFDKDKDDWVKICDVDDIIQISLDGHSYKFSF